MFWAYFSVMCSTCFSLMCLVCFQWCVQPVFFLMFIDELSLFSVMCPACFHWWVQPVFSRMCSACCQWCVAILQCTLAEFICRISSFYWCCSVCELAGLMACSSAIFLQDAVKHHHRFAACAVKGWQGWQDWLLVGLLFAAGFIIVGARWMFVVVLHVKRSDRSIVLPGCQW